MGYNLYIGQAVMKFYDKEEAEEIGEETYLDVEIEDMDDAPAYGEPTDNTNMRWPSYTSWSNFARFTGLYDFFYNKETGLIRTHPGEVQITKEHKEVIDKAYEDFMEKYPNAEAGYPEKDGGESWPEENSYLVRLLWLKYWVDWSLENCENPIFKNT